MIRLYAADNRDALRGRYLDDVVLDEFADMKPDVWNEVVTPMLADRQGWAKFIVAVALTKPRPKPRLHLQGVG